MTRHFDKKEHKKLARPQAEGAEDGFTSAPLPPRQQPQRQRRRAPQPRDEEDDIVEDDSYSLDPDVFPGAIHVDGRGRVSYRHFYDNSDDVVTTMTPATTTTPSTNNNALLFEGLPSAIVAELASDTDVERDELRRQLEQERLHRERMERERNQVIMAAVASEEETRYCYGWFQSRQQQRYVLLIFLVIFLVSAALGIAAIMPGISFIGGRDDGTPPPTMTPTSNPAAPSSPPPSPLPPTSKVFSSLEPSGFDRIKHLRERLAAYGIDTSSIDDVASHHFQAFTWMTTQDEWYATTTILEDDNDVYFVERYVAALFYFTTNGNNWSNQPRFLSSETVCNWNLYNGKYHDGILCNSNGFIQQILMTENNMAGSIISEIALLSKLDDLWLPNNSLDGPLPSHMGLLTELTWLGLSSNELGGREQIPSELGNLSKLQDFSLSGNTRFSDWPTGIPTEFGRLTELTALSLFSMSMGSTIPSELGQLANLQRLSLYDNQFSGTVPRELGNLAESSLESLLLDENPFLTGSLDDLFCANVDIPLVDPSPLIPEIEADCPTTIECSCCTFCSGSPK